MRVRIGQLPAAMVACGVISACTVESGNGGAADAPADTGGAVVAEDSAGRDTGGAPGPGGGAGPALRADGIGDIEAGISLVDATDRAGTSAVDPDPGAECRYVTFPTLPDGVSLMVIRDTVRRVDVDSPDVLTDRGAGIGTTTARVEELYGAGLERMPHKYEPDGEYLIVAGTRPDTRLVFETALDTVRTMRAGVMPEVMWVERCG